MQPQKISNSQLDLFKENLKEVYSDFQIILPYEQKINHGKKGSKITSCDLMIILDCTGSMQSWISACKQNILKIIDNVKEQFAGSELRVGLVAYRDHCDKKRLEIYPFINKDYEGLQSFISSLRAEGGGDEPEDLAGALEAAINNFEWKSQAKTMIIITDAPCHGNTYHSVSDTYPHGCPNGIDIEEYIYIIGKKGIDLNVIDIQNQTNKMFEIFSQIYQDARGKPLIRLKLGQNTLDFGKQITQTVATTITCTSQKSHTGDEVYQKAFRILRAQKGLLNTKCLSKTELDLLQASQGKTDFEQPNITSKQKQIIEEENEDSEEEKDEEVEEQDEEEEKKQDEEEEGFTSKNMVKEQKELQKLRLEWELKKNLQNLENPSAETPTPIPVQEEKPSKKMESYISKGGQYIPTLMSEQMDWENGFNTIHSFNLSCTCLTPYVDKRNEVNWNNPVIKVQQLTSKFKVMKRYFAEGAMRFAFFAFDSFLNQKLVAKLHKDMKSNSNFELMKRDSMSLIACHYFAEEFNSRILLKTEVDAKTSILLNFVNSTIYEVIGHTNKDIKYYFVENLIEGEYQKYNNNAGWTNMTTSSEFNQITQAFSHFTWQYSHGQLLVVDIQGGENGILTDPQIHTKNRSKLYGSGDLGYEGMLRFFYTHNCNSYCEKLNLLHPKNISDFPEKFEFFDNLFGLDLNEPKNVQPIVIGGDNVVEYKEESLIDEPSEKDNNNKKKKKKRGQYHKIEQEKQKILQEQIELQKKKEEEEKQEEEKNKAIQANKDERQVLTQCSLCKKCFQASRSLVIHNRQHKLETLCEYCQLQCSLSQLDLACTTCGKLFQISKYYCKMKKINLIGKCIKCRE